MLNMDRLTLGEVARIEDLSGQSIAQFGDEDKPQGLMLAALAFVAARRERLAGDRPDELTWPQALDLTMDEANVLVFGGDAATEDGDAPAPEPPTKRGRTAPKEPTPETS